MQCGSGSSDRILDYHVATCAVASINVRTTLSDP
jgi:hypothetical protein